MRRIAVVSIGLALAAGGCGGSATQAHHATKPVDSLAVVHAAAAKATAAKTLHFTMRMQMGPSGQQLKMAMNGGMNLVARYGSFTGLMSLSLPNAGANSMQFSAVLTPTAMYMQMPILTSRLHKPWVRFDFAALSKVSGVNFQQLLQQSQQSNPAIYLQMLAASGDIKVIGHDSVDGVRTTHYAGTVPVSHLDKNLPASLRAQLAPLLTQTGVQNVSLDAWISGDGLPRRVVESFDSSITGAANIAMDLTQYGAPVSVTVPPASEVADLAALLNGRG